MKRNDNLQIDIDNRTDTQIHQNILQTIQDAVAHTLNTLSLTRAMEVSVSIVQPKEIKTLNADYRDIPEETDVLSFPMYASIEDLQNAPQGQPAMLGDIVLSLERAGEQARQYGHSLERELYYLTVHSVLHLLGYDHLREEDKLPMRQMEKTIMSTSPFANDDDKEGKNEHESKF